MLIEPRKSVGFNENKHGGFNVISPTFLRSVELVDGLSSKNGENDDVP